VGLITTLRCSIKLYGGAGVSPAEIDVDQKVVRGTTADGHRNSPSRSRQRDGTARRSNDGWRRAFVSSLSSRKNPFSNASTNRAIAERWKVSRLTYATSTRCTSTVSYFDVCTHPSSRLCRARPQFAAPRYSSNFSMRCWTANGRRRKHSRGLDQPQPAATVHSYIIQVETASCCRATPRTPQPRLYFLAHPTRRQS
jgi:hypothetical protein